MPTRWDRSLEILQEISDAIIVSDNIHTLAHLMLDLAIRHTGAEKGSLMVVNERDELYILSARGVDERFLRNYRVKMGEGIAGSIAKQGEPVLVKNLDSDERFLHARRDRYKTSSFVSCPLKGKSSVLGVININDKKDGSAFTEEEFTLIKTIANQAAVALKNVLLVRKLKTQAAELEEVNRKLTDNDVAKTEFLTRISHELRTPLNGIKGAVYYLSHSPAASEEDRSDFLRIIDAEANKLISFSERQLDFLRFEDEAKTMDNKLLRLEKVIQETFDSRLLQKCLKEKGVQVRTDLPKGLPDLVGDRILVGQLFINLLDGICAHLEKGAVLTVTALESDSLEVRIDLSQPLPERLVQCFYTAGSEAVERIGDCVKIYLALKNADAHGWSYGARNEPGGFQFTLRIPKNPRQRMNAAIDATMDMLVEFTSELLEVNTCSVMLTDEFTGDLAIRSARGLDEEIIRRTRIKIGERIAGWVAHEGKPLLIEDIESDPRFGRRNLDRQYGSPSLMCLPLTVKGKVVGVINLNNRKNGHSFNPRDLRVARVFSARISSFLENLQEETFSETDLSALVSSLNNLLQAERSYHKKDSRMLDLVDGVLERIAASEEERDLALYVALVYDLGLMAIEKSILEKKGKLTAKDIATLKFHPFTTVDLLAGVEPSEKIRKIILHHHEKYDGTGYPDGLRGEEIPLLCRVLAVVDAWCAMSEDRPWRKSLSREETLTQIQRESGRAFDPEVVRVFLSLQAGE